VTEFQARPTWDEFSAHLSSTAPVLVRLLGVPPVDLFVEAGGKRIGIRVSTPDPVTPLDSHFSALVIGVVHLEDGDHLEISTSIADLYPYFFAFALSIADGVQEDGSPPTVALQRSLRDWEALFERLSMLTEERQLGLLGELWLFERLLRQHGAAAMEAWTGPLGQAHDFRIGEFEFEVKATSGEHRTHIISSDSQLVSSPGHQLFVLSLQFTAGGPGTRSLRNVIEGLRNRLAPLHLTGYFDRLLERTFQIPTHRLSEYGRGMQLRSPPYLVPVVDSFPRVTHFDILGLPRPEMVRISDLRYRVDVEGLGWEDGTPEFLAIIPEVSW